MDIALPQHIEAQRRSGAGRTALAALAGAAPYVRRRAAGFRPDGILTLGRRVLARRH
jgi:hypothetical protein